MSNLTYSAYPGYGTWAAEASHYSQAVRVGNTVHISGQGGWDPQTRELKPTLEEEFEQAFANVQTTLQDAGVAGGWDAVYKARMYVTADVEGGEDFRLPVECLRRWCPGHKIVLTAVIVAKLAFGMHFEVEVSAVAGEGQQ